MCARIECMSIPLDGERKGFATGLNILEKGVRAGPDFLVS